MPADKFDAHIWELARDYVMSTPEQRKEIANNLRVNPYTFSRAVSVVARGLLHAKGKKPDQESVSALSDMMKDTQTRQALESTLGENVSAEEFNDMVVKPLLAQGGGYIPPTASSDVMSTYDLNRTGMAFWQHLAGFANSIPRGIIGIEDAAFKLIHLGNFERGLKDITPGYELSKETSRAAEEAHRMIQESYLSNMQQKKATVSLIASLLNKHNSGKDLTPGDIRNLRKGILLWNTVKDLPEAQSLIGKIADFAAGMAEDIPLFALTEGIGSAAIGGATKLFTTAEKYSGALRWLSRGKGWEELINNVEIGKAARNATKYIDKFSHTSNLLKNYVAPQAVRATTNGGLWGLMEFGQHGEKPKDLFKSIISNVAMFSLFDVGVAGLGRYMLDKGIAPKVVDTALENFAGKQMNAGIGKIRLKIANRDITDLKGLKKEIRDIAVRSIVLPSEHAPFLRGVISPKRTVNRMLVEAAESGERLTKSEGKIFREGFWRDLYKQFDRDTKLKEWGEMMEHPGLYTDAEGATTIGFTMATNPGAGAVKLDVHNVIRGMDDDQFLKFKKKLVHDLSDTGVTVEYQGGNFYLFHDPKVNSEDVVKRVKEYLNLNFGENTEGDKQVVDDFRKALFEAAPEGAREGIEPAMVMLKGMARLNDMTLSEFLDKTFADIRPGDEATALKDALSQIGYHATDKDFERMLSEMAGSRSSVKQYGHGLYFSGDKKKADSFAEFFKKFRGKGNVYKVELPDKGWIDWDKPITQGQRKAISDVLRKKGEISAARRLERLKAPNGEDIYKFAMDVTGSKRRASELLSRAGIVGNRYVEIAAKEGKPVKYGFVVFNDKDTRILFKETLTQLLGKGKGEILGATSFLDDGRAVVQLFKKANPSTVIHELFHAGRRHLPEADIKALEEALGVRDGVWKPKHEEAAARAMEQYVMTGKSPHPELNGIFEKMKKFMLDIYGSIKNIPEIVGQIHPQVKQVFDRIWSASGYGDMPNVPIERATIEATDRAGFIESVTKSKLGANFPKAAKSADWVKKAFEEHMQEVEGYYTVKKALDKLSEKARADLSDLLSGRSAGKDIPKESVKQIAEILPTLYQTTEGYTRDDELWQSSIHNTAIDILVGNLNQTLVPDELKGTFMTKANVAKQLPVIERLVKTLGTAIATAEKGDAKEAGALTRKAYTDAIYQLFNSYKSNSKETFLIWHRKFKTNPNPGVLDLFSFVFPPLENALNEGNPLMTAIFQTAKMVYDTAQGSSTMIRDVLAKDENGKTIRVSSKLFGLFRMANKDPDVFVDLIEHPEKAEAFRVEGDVSAEGFKTLLLSYDAIRKLAAKLSGFTNPDAMRYFSNSMQGKYALKITSYDGDRVIQRPYGFTKKAEQVIDYATEAGKKVHMEAHAKPMADDIPSLIDQAKEYVIERYSKWLEKFRGKELPGTSVSDLKALLETKDGEAAVLQYVDIVTGRKVEHPEFNREALAKMKAPKSPTQLLMRNLDDMMHPDMDIKGKKGKTTIRATDRLQIYDTYSMPEKEFGVNLTRPEKKIIIRTAISNALKAAEMGGEKLTEADKKLIIEKTAETVGKQISQKVPHHATESMYHMRKYDLPDFIEDYNSWVSATAMQFSNHIVLNPLIDAITDIMQKAKVMGSEESNYFTKRWERYMNKRYLEHLRGGMSDMDIATGRAISNAWKAMTGRETSSVSMLRKGSEFIAGYEALTKLMGPFKAVLNFTQNSFHLARIGVAKFSTNLYKYLTDPELKAAAEMVGRTTTSVGEKISGGSISGMRSYMSSNMAIKDAVKYLRGEEFGQGLPSMLKAVLSGSQWLFSTKPFSRSEAFNRNFDIASFYMEKAKLPGYEDILKRFKTGKLTLAEEIQSNAWVATDHFFYDRSNTPIILMNPIARSMGIFANYKINFIGQMIDMARYSAKDIGTIMRKIASGSIKDITKEDMFWLAKTGRFMATYGALGGLRAVPAMAMFYWIGALRGTKNEDTGAYQKFYDLLHYGVPSVFGMQFTSALELNLLPSRSNGPGDMMAQLLGGPMFSTILNAYKATTNMSFYPGKSKILHNPITAFLAMELPYVKRVTDAMTMQYNSTMKPYQMPMKATPYESGLMALGMLPFRRFKYNEMISEAYKDREKAMNASRKVAREYTYAITKLRDPVIAARVLEEGIENGVVLDPRLLHDYATQAATPEVIRNKLNLPRKSEAQFLAQVYNLHSGYDEDKAYKMIINAAKDAYDRGDDTLGNKYMAEIKTGRFKRNSVLRRSLIMSIQAFKQMRYSPAGMKYLTPADKRAYDKMFKKYEKIIGSKR